MIQQHSHNPQLRRRLTGAILTLVLSMFIPAGAYAADIFESLAGQKQVESTYVSGRWAHNMPLWTSRDNSHSINLSRGFSALYSYDIYYEENVKEARKILDKYLKENPDVELMMRSSESEGREYAVYEKFNSEGNITQLILWNKMGTMNLEIVVIDYKNGLPPLSKKDN